MTLKTGSIVFVGILLVAAGVAWWLGQGPVPTSDTTTGPFAFPADMDNGTSAGFNNGNGGGAATVPKEITAPDINTHYTELYSNLQANKVEFETLNSTGPYAALYALYSADRAAYEKIFPANTGRLLVAAIDLNGDGVDEAIVYEDFFGYCGSGGCALDIYKKEKTVWVSILSAQASKNVGISYAAQNGYAVLFLSVEGAGLGYQTQIVRYIAINEKYQPADTVATWNGAMFKRPRK
ncbi:hypothetical protein EXS62_02870 [Candidatus Kaiserbacteria bacterium]|nr:hypothetical protein [Candidatus Kaiserbacteria bacterium]